MKRSVIRAANSDEMLSGISTSHGSASLDYSSISLGSGINRVDCVGVVFSFEGKRDPPVFNDSLKMYGSDSSTAAYIMKYNRDPQPDLHDAMSVIRAC